VSHEQLIEQAQAALAALGISKSTLQLEQQHERCRERAVTDETEGASGTHHH
jgi:hypothetical protein